MADNREMTAEQRAKELADHCRYCGMPDYRPKCKADYEHQIDEIAAAIRQAYEEGKKDAVQSDGNT